MDGVVSCCVDGTVSSLVDGAVAARVDGVVASIMSRVDGVVASCMDGFVASRVDVSTFACVDEAVFSGNGVPGVDMVDVTSFCGKVGTSVSCEETVLFFGICGISDIEEKKTNKDSLFMNWWQF